MYRTHPARRSGQEGMTIIHAMAGATAMRAAVIALGRFTETLAGGRDAGHPAAGARRYASDLRTSLLTAFSVSNTPSPLTATASKYVARSTHSPEGSCSMRFSPACAASGVTRWRDGSVTSHPGLSASCSWRTGAAFGRSRLLYWITK